MTSKERVVAAFERKKTDRPPTSLRCTPEAWAKLMEHFNVATVNDVLDVLDIDMRWIRLPYKGPQERSAITLGSEGRDFWGCIMKKAQNEFNVYYDIVEHPLAGAKSVDEVLSYDWPDLDWWDYGAVAGMISKENKKEPRAIMFFAGGAFETPWYIRGLEAFLMDLVINPEIANAICAKVEEYYRKRAQRVLEATDGAIDIIGTGGDVGGQQAMMLSPDVWREHIKPYTGGLISFFKGMGLKTFYHSDGSIVPIINDLIEVGLDVLDPIQVTAKGMQPEELFPLFGDRLSFHGAIDEVELLPHATAKQVYDETTRIIGILGEKHGYIVSATHNIQGDTDVDNILAIFQAAKDFRY